MATLVVKNFPEALHEGLRRRAEQNHRSMTQEAIVLLEQGLAAPERKPFKLPPPVRLKGGPLTIEQIEDARTEGRA